MGEATKRKKLRGKKLGKEKGGCWEMGRSGIKSVLEGGKRLLFGNGSANQGKGTAKK